MRAPQFFRYLPKKKAPGADIRPPSLRGSRDSCPPPTTGTAACADGNRMVMNDARRTRPLEWTAAESEQRRSDGRVQSSLSDGLALCVAHRQVVAEVEMMYS